MIASNMSTIMTICEKVNELVNVAMVTQIYMATLTAKHNLEVSFGPSPKLASHHTAIQTMTTSPSSEHCVVRHGT